MQPSPSSIPATAVAARVHPVRSFGGTVRLPGSKSITNRALLMAALAEGTSIIRNALDCDDSRYLLEALGALGIETRRGDGEETILVRGAGGPFPAKEGSFFLGNAGTALRFLTAALSASGGNFVVDGDARMRERPIADLVKALVSLGGDASTATGCPPVKIGPRPLVGGRVDIPGSVSSQFISAILMAAPLAPRRVELRVTGELVSRPYIDLTLHEMREFGAKVFADDKRADGEPLFEVVPARSYRARDYFVEGDASAASYFFAGAAVTGGTVRVEGVGKESRQGDARCADVLARMGCFVKKDREAITVTGGLLRSVDWNCADIPDVVPTLAVTALFASGRSRFRGVAHLRHKESDRIASVAAEIRKLGGQVRELPDGLEVEGTLGPNPNTLHETVVDTWGDHRIAMAFAVAALVVPGVVIAAPQVVRKSFPTYFDELGRLGVKVEYVEKDGRTLPGAPERPAGEVAP